MYDCHLRGEGMHCTPGAGGCSSGLAGYDELEAREAKYHWIDSPNRVNEINTMRSFVLSLLEISLTSHFGLTTTAPPPHPPTPTPPHSSPGDCNRQQWHTVQYSHTASLLVKAVIEMDTGRLVGNSILTSCQSAQGHSGPTLSLVNLILHWHQS